MKEIRPAGGVIKYRYNGAAKLLSKSDRKKQQLSYSYRRDYLPLKIEYRDQDGKVLESKEYRYDREGNRLLARRNDTDQNSSSSSSTITTSYNPLGLISAEDRKIDSKSYSSSYRYDRLGKISGIRYPGSDSYLEYKYNDLNHLVAVAGISKASIDNSSNDLTFAYRDNGFLSEVNYPNGTTTTISPDSNYRIDNIRTTKNNGGVREKLLDISYNYDQNNNLIKRIDNLSNYTNQYHYDQLDRLVSTDLEGTFYGERTGLTGVAEEDQLRYKALKVKKDYLVDFDYKASSVGVILMEKTAIGKIVLTPAPGIINHRITKDTISIHYSADNFIYLKVPKKDWEFSKDQEGRVTITALAFKVHSNHDDRDLDNNYLNLSTFSNKLEDIVKVYQRADEGKLEYSYDSGGNRTERHRIVGNDDSTEYQYYPDSNRLKKASYTVSGKTYKEYYYLYDANGNLTAKGNHISRKADGSLSLDKDSPGSRYWEYEYTADNLLQKAYYKGELKAEYSYDADGKRIVSKTAEGTTHFVFDYSGKAIYEEKVTNAEDNSTSIEQISYIYALSKQMARIEGVIGGEGEVTYYHHDNLGSTRLMTNEEGNVVFDQDYLPFGGDLAVVGDLEPKNEVGESYKYTGQREEASIGLYYYGARFYDPELGRFVSEDTYAGELSNPQSENVYIYTLNNPMKYVDPSGNFVEEYKDDYQYPVEGTVEKGDTLSDISLKIYGDEVAAKALANMNDLENIDSINEGQKLLLPGVAYDGSGGAYMQPGFIDGAREVSDAFIAFTSLGTAGLEAGGLEVLTVAGSSAYTAADKAFEKGYYWASDKLARLQNVVSDKIGRLFNRGISNPAHSAAQYENMKADLLRRELGVKPNVQNPKLRNIVNDLYKGQTTSDYVGNGTTMDAIRNELITGEPTKGIFHLQKGGEYSNSLGKLLNSLQNMSKSDINVANKLLKDLTNALNGK